MKGPWFSSPVPKWTHSFRLHIHQQSAHKGLQTTTRAARTSRSYDHDGLGTGVFSLDNDTRALHKEHDDRPYPQKGSVFLFGGLQYSSRTFTGLENIARPRTVPQVLERTGIARTPKPISIISVGMCAVMSSAQEGYRPVPRSNCFCVCSANWTAWFWATYCLF